MSELVELRARQRTFHGAYSRSAMGNLGYALTILRLFDHRFYKGMSPSPQSITLFMIIKSWTSFRRPGMPPLRHRISAVPPFTA